MPRFFLYYCTFGLETCILFLGIHLWTKLWFKHFITLSEFLTCFLLFSNIRHGVLRPPLSFPTPPCQSAPPNPLFFFPRSGARLAYASGPLFIDSHLIFSPHSSKIWVAKFWVLHGGLVFIAIDSFYQLSSQDYILSKYHLG